MSSGMRLSMRVWDLPIRLFHGLVTLLLIAAYATWRTHHIRWHILCGETLLALLLWRILWGFVGSDTARLRAFLRNPAARDTAATATGHAAAGGWWVLVMLALLLLQVLSGLFRLPALHAAGFYILIAAIVIHLLLVAWHAAGSVKNPLRAIITGKQRMPAAMQAPRMAGSGFALLVLLCAAGAVLLLANGLGR